MGIAMIAASPALGPAFSSQTLLVRSIGAVVCVFAAWAGSLSLIESPDLLQRCFFWFTATHVGMFFFVAVPQEVVIGRGRGDVLTACLFSVSIMLIFQLQNSNKQPEYSTTLFGTPKEPVRTRYEQELRAVAAQEERNRLARDLHDSIKQQLFVIQTAAATAEVRLASGQDQVAEAISQVRGAARESMTEMEAMIEQLQAEPLEMKGLIAALRKQCEALGFRTGANVNVQIGELPASLLFEPGALQAIYRIAQESLANIGRHARATEVEVSLASGTSYLELTVKDNGSGFDTEHAPKGMGLSNMRSRVEEYGGTFEVTSRLGEGTLIRADIPFRSEPKRGCNSIILVGVLGIQFFVTFRRHIPPKGWMILAAAIVFAFLLLRKRDRP